MVVVTGVTPGEFYTITHNEYKKRIIIITNYARLTYIIIYNFCLITVLVAPPGEQNNTSETSTEAHVAVSRTK